MIERERYAPKGFLNNWRIATAVNTILISAALVFTTILYVQGQNTTDRIRESQVEACEAGLKPGGVRYIIAERIREELEQQKKVDYTKLFPTTPADELTALIEAGRERDYAQINALLGVDCDSLYQR